MVRALRLPESWGSRRRDAGAQLTLCLPVHYMRLCRLDAGGTPDAPRLRSRRHGDAAEIRNRFGVAGTVTHVHLVAAVASGESLAAIGRWTGRAQNEGKRRRIEPRRARENRGKQRGENSKVTTMCAVYAATFAASCGPLGESMRFGGFACYGCGCLPPACALAVAQPQLDEKESRMAAAIASRKDAALAFLKRTVAINSGTLNTEGVRANRQTLPCCLRGFGFCHAMVEMPPEMKRAGQFGGASFNQGKDQRKTVAAPTWIRFSGPIARSNHGRPMPTASVMWGQGVSDMKGGNSVMLEALSALKSAGAPRWDVDPRHAHR